MGKWKIHLKKNEFGKLQVHHINIRINFSVSSYFLQKSRVKLKVITRCGGRERHARRAGEEERHVLATVAAAGSLRLITPPSLASAAVQDKLSSEWKFLIL